MSSVVESNAGTNFVELKQAQINALKTKKKNLFNESFLNDANNPFTKASLLNGDFLGAVTSHVLGNLDNIKLRSKLNRQIYDLKNQNSFGAKQTALNGKDLTLDLINANTQRNDAMNSYLGTTGDADNNLGTVSSATIRSNANSKISLNRKAMAQYQKDALAEAKQTGDMETYHQNVAAARDRMRAENQLIRANKRYLVGANFDAKANMIDLKKEQDAKVRAERLQQRFQDRVDRVNATNPERASRMQARALALANAQAGIRTKSSIAAPTFSHRIGGIINYSKFFKQ